MEINIKTNSLKVKPGDTFIALRGVGSDGHSYINTAIENGATKIIAEEGNYSIETLIVKDTRYYLANYLKRTYKEELSELKLVGITGTNGKTTVSYLIHDALNKLGIKTAYIGTNGYYINNKLEYKLPNTTPDLLESYNVYLDARNKGCKIIIQEVTSEAIYYDRLNGIEFDISLFTNISRDHLNTHGTMENYINEKQKLFKNHTKKRGLAIINNDDIYSYTFNNIIENTVTYGKKTSDFQFTKYENIGLSTFFELINEENIYDVISPLLGEFNIYNILALIVVVNSLGFSIEEIINILPNINMPLGRMETISFKTNKIIIDYAHTPDAIEKILEVSNTFTKGKIYTIFGPTGNRDREKRPIMMDITTKLSDYVILTTEDIRGESIDQIINDTLKNVEKDNYEVIIDREEAIKKGVSLLKENDTLLVLGRGHEEYIYLSADLKEKKLFNDKDVVNKYIV